MLPKQAEMEEEKKEEKKKSYHMCNLQQFYNLINHFGANLYDLRSVQQYKQSHVNGAENIPQPMVYIIYIRYI